MLQNWGRRILRSLETSQYFGGICELNLRRACLTHELESSLDCSPLMAGLCAIRFGTLAEHFLKERSYVDVASGEVGHAGEGVDDLGVDEVVDVGGGVAVGDGNGAGDDSVGYSGVDGKCT
jgi:hypothetical protein